MCTLRDHTDVNKQCLDFSLCVSLCLYFGRFALRVSTLNRKMKVKKIINTLIRLLLILWFHTAAEKKALSVLQLIITFTGLAVTFSILLNEPFLKIV